MPQTAEPPSAAAPGTIRAAATIVVAESAALVVAAVLLTVLTLTHSTTRLWAALAIIAFTLAGAGILALCALGVSRLRPSGRAPIMLVQLLALPVAYSLGVQAGRTVIAAPIMTAAVAVLVLLLTPSARKALDRPV